MSTTIAPSPEIERPATAKPEAKPDVKPVEHPAEQPVKTYRQIGVSRPPMEVLDLPTPEQVFNVRKMGWQEMALLALGPSVIALGISLGSGEWILGPLNVGRYGLRGIFWVVLVSVVLQVFYNVELARYTMATGEPPVVGFGRTPPGWWVWIPLALLSFYAAFILGGWAVSAGTSLFALIVARQIQPDDLETCRLIGIGLMFTVYLMLMVGRKIERTMEAVQGLFIPYILVGLLMVTAVVVPGWYLGEAAMALVIPSRPPAGADATLLGALAGFAALASGLNFMFIGYYRDKGYGMGHYTGYLPSLFNRSAPPVEPVGKTFAETEENARRWKRWFRILLLDQWGVYFMGALLGMVLPTVLFGYLLTESGLHVTDQNSMLYMTSQLLGQRYGQLVSGWALVLGFVILYSTQIGVLELLARNLTDGVYGASERFRRWTNHEPRRFYSVAILALIGIIAFFIHTAVPVQLSLISANLANFAALLFPLALIYLNLQLPRPAKIRWWSVLVLLMNTLFFGFFFINFLAVQLTGTPLVEF